MFSSANASLCRGLVLCLQKCSNPRNRAVQRCLHAGSSKWQTAGGGSMVHGLEEIKRTTVANCDNSDIFSPDRVSFGNMTTYHFIRSVLVLRLCSLPGFSDHAHKVLQVARKCLGKTLFSYAMRRTVYGQFVAGNETEEIREAAQKLAECNLKTMLAVPIEADAGGADIGGEQLLNSNLDKVLECIDISSSIRDGETPSLMQVKLMALVDYNVLAKVSAVLDGEAIRPNAVAAWMQNGCQIETLDAVLPGLTERQRDVFVSGMRRIVKAFDYAAQHGIYVLVDAEYTWINPALNLLTIASMMVYNRSRPIVWNTYQAYLKDTQTTIQDHYKICADQEIVFAFKLVRGAYLLQETQKAGCHPPGLCDDWSHTNENYDSCLYECIKMDPRLTEIVLATHNENSVRLAAELLQRRADSGITSSNVSFAQLYGMSDYMGYTLGKMGYNVYKSVPYGSIEDTLQYLARRAKENTLFLTGIRKDMDMLKRGLANSLKKKSRDDNSLSD